MSPRSKRQRAKDMAAPATATPPELAPPTPPRPLTHAERAEVAALDARLRQRPSAPLLEADAAGNPTPTAALPNRLLMARLARALGTPDAVAMTVLLNQALEAGENKDLVLNGNAALGLLAGIAPRDEAEGMLAVQMVAAHNLALTMARRARNTDRLDCLATYGRLSAQFMTVYTRQLETLARLRGHTVQQVVRVERVEVQAGGQALVGNVAPKGRGDGDES